MLPFVSTEEKKNQPNLLVWREEIRFNFSSLSPSTVELQPKNRGFDWQLVRHQD